MIKAERALLAELLNRGPQTTGELNTRASRMFHFDGLSDVEDTLTELSERDPSLTELMDPIPGRKERRWFHKLAPLPKIEELEGSKPVFLPTADKRLDLLSENLEEFKDLKEEVEALRYEVREIKSELINFRKEFE